MKSDAVRLESIRRMEKDALIQVFDEYAPSLFKYAMRTCWDAQIADQVVGDVFANLLEQLACGKGPTSNLGAYLFETASHLLIDHIRYTRQHISLEEYELNFFHELAVEPNMEGNILHRAVLQAMQEGLTASQRNVVILRFLNGFSLKETAQILGKSVNLVKVTQNRAVAILSACLYDWTRT